MRNIHGRKLLNFSIKRNFQLRLLGKVLGIAIVGIGIMAAVFYFYSNREITESYRQFHVEAKNFLDYLWPAVFMSLLLAIFAAVAITLFFPQKIAGPLYRIENDLKEKICKGDLTHTFTLRKGDEVTDLAEALNSTIHEIRQNIEKIREPAVELESKLNAPGMNTSNDIATLSRKINDALRAFKLP